MVYASNADNVDNTGNIVKMTTNKTQIVDFSYDVNQVLNQLNDKLVEIAREKMLAKKYMAKSNTSEDIFFILSRYKNILIKKANNHQCFQSYLIDDIISNIEQYIHSGAIQKC